MKAPKASSSRSQHNLHNQLRQPSETSPLLLQEDPDKPTAKYSLTLILPAIWIGSFLSALDGTIVANTLTSFSEDFHRESLKSWIATAYLLTNCSFQPLYGKVSDIIGRKYPLMFAQSTFGLGLLLSALTPKGSFWWFVISRGISGMGGGGLAAMSSIIVSDIVSLEERGIFQAYANLNFAFGQLTGAPLGAWGIQYLGWRWLLGAQVPFVLLCMVLTFWNINIDVPGASEEGKLKRLADRVDFKGSLSLVTCITSFLLLLSLNDVDHWISFSLFILTVVSLSAFIYIEKYIAIEQILPLKLVQGTIGILGVLSFTTTFVIFTAVYQIPSYLQIVQNQSIQSSSKYLMAIIILSSLGSIIAGFWLKRVKGDIKKVGYAITFISSALTVLSCLALALVLSHYQVYDTNEGFFYPLLFTLSFIGLSYGMSLVAVLVVIVATVGKEGQATATGMNYLFRSTAQVLSVGISISIYDQELTRRLWKVLKDIENGSVIYKKILDNVEYLKTLITDQELLIRIVEQYNVSLEISFIPMYALAAIGLALSLWLFISKSKK